MDNGNHCGQGGYYFENLSTGGDGILLSGVTDALVSGNNVSGCPKSGIAIKNCDRFDVHDDMLNRNQNGISIQAVPTATGEVHNNTCAENKNAGIAVTSKDGKLPAGVLVKDNQTASSGND